MLWAIFLHFYQPPNQTAEILSDVVDKSYRPILEVLKKNPSGKITVNLDGGLIDQLLRSDFKDIILDLKELMEKGQVEIVSSVKYHAFLPLIPEIEIARRVKAGLLTNQQIFGPNWQPRGFFPTELAVNGKIVKVVKRLGFSYLLADEISLNGRIEGLETRKLYEDQGVKIFFVNRKVSSRLRSDRELTFEKLTSLVLTSNSSYLVSANDAELFGHHYLHREEILAEILKGQGKSWETVTLSELEKRISETLKIKVQRGSWETSKTDLKKGLPFPLWYDPQNLVQKLYWQLSWLVISSFNRLPSKEKNDPGFIWHSARDHLNRGLASCYLFWASCRPWWNPDMVVVGATELVRVTRTLEEVGLEEKKRAEDLYVRIIKTAWDWHWSGEAKRRIDQFEIEESRQKY